jgi:hypothetical protein
MRPSQAYFDELFLSKVRASQSVSPEERLLSSLRLSDDCVEIMRAGIRHQFPHASEQEVEQRLIERVRNQKRVQEGR